MDSEDKELLNSGGFSRRLEALSILQNNYPVSDFLGITANEMNHILYNPFSSESPFKLKQISKDLLQQIPFFLITEHLLKIISTLGSLKLTKTGNLPVKICRDLYDQKYIPERTIDVGIQKLSSENDLITIKTSRIILEISKLVIKRHNKLNISKRASNMLKKRQISTVFYNLSNILSEVFVVLFGRVRKRYGWAIWVCFLIGYAETIWIKS